MIDRPYNSSLHRLAVLTAAATFPLIFMGGLVTTKQAGMSVPDWPNSYGYNMFLFPPRLWTGGVFYEHLHRLMGAIVGILCIALAVHAWITERRPWVRNLAVGLLFAVILQGTLGGLRVVLMKLGLAIVHACLAQAVFCFAALVAVVTSRFWIETPDRSTSDAAGHSLIWMGIITIAIIYTQLILGAEMRHHQAGLAITDLPLAYGKLLPPTNAAELAAVNRQRTFPPVKVIRAEDYPAYEQLTSRVTMGQVWIHFAHRVGAVCVTIAATALVVLVMRKHRHQAALVIPAMVLAGLLIAQLTLGVLTVLLWKPADIATSHVAVGALTLMTAFLLTVRACRLYLAHPMMQQAGFEVLGAVPAHC